MILASGITAKCQYTDIKYTSSMLNGRDERGTYNRGIVSAFFLLAFLIHGREEKSGAGKSETASSYVADPLVSQCPF